MSWTDEEQRRVASALLGSWPGTITAWGREAFAAYLSVLQSRGLSAEQVVAAILSWPAGSDFPPSAPNLAAAAGRDVSTPTFPELLQLLYGRGGVFRAQPPSKGLWVDGERDRAIEQARRERLSSLHPLVVLFVDRQGLDRLARLELDDPQFGQVRRRELEQAWTQHVEAMGDRQVAALVSGGSGGLRRLDPLSVLDVPAAITAGSTSGEDTP